MKAIIRPLIFFAVCLCLKTAAAEDLISRYKDQWADAESFEMDAESGVLCLAVKGNPAGAAFARLPFAFVPSAWYELSVQVRFEQDAFASAVMVGTDFANRDVHVTDEWVTVVFRFSAPQNSGDHYVRLGLWQGNGRVLFRILRLLKLLPVHARQFGVELGSGESIATGCYSAHYYYASTNTYVARTLDRFDAYFNTNRWDLTDGRQVVYRHHLGSRRQTGGRLALKTSFRQSGYLEIFASKTGVDWQTIGMISRLGPAEFVLPSALFPTNQVFIRIQAGTPPTRIQIDEYRYEAEVDSAAPNLNGSTRVLRLDKQAEVVKIEASDNGRLRLAVDTPVPLKIVHPDEQDKTIERIESRSILFNLQEMWKGRRVLLDADDDTLLVMQSEEPLKDEQEYGERLIESDGAILWYCESMRKIGRSQLPPGPSARWVSCAAARNEYEAVQIVVFAKKPIHRLSARVDPFRHASGAVLPADSITVYHVDYVQVRVPTDQRGASGLWPDPLLPFDQPVSVPAECNQPIWLSIHVPAECPAGEYFSRVVLQMDAETFEVPIRLTVWDFTLPRETHLQSAVGLYLSTIQRYHHLTDNKSLQQVFELYLRNLARHRLAPFDPFALSPIRVDVDAKSLGVRVDFTRFDQAYQRYVQGLGFNTFRLSIPGLPSGNSLTLQPGSLAGFTEGTPQYETLAAVCLRQVRAHLEKLGALDQAYLYWFDEPEPKDYPYIRRVNQWIASEAPGLAKLLTEQPAPALFGAVDIWCPILHQFRQETAEERKRKGERVWWYICTNPKAPYPGMFIDHPAVELRTWIWMAWKYGVQGILLWSVNYWTSDNAFPPPARQDPYQDPMSYRSGSGVQPGERSYWGNGDGRLIYPPPDYHAAARIEGPVNSIRWEILRDGIEDYEYLVLLQKLIEANRRLGRSSLLPTAEELLEVPEEICASLTSFSLSPEPILERRKRLAEMIVALQTAVRKP